jgi:hypothetical protein
VFLENDPSAFLVAETPGEIMGLVDAAERKDETFVTLTSANEGSWNGRPIYIRQKYIRSIAPPMNHVCPGMGGE